MYFHPEDEPLELVLVEHDSPRRRPPQIRSDAVQLPEVRRCPTDDCRSPVTLGQDLAHLDQRRGKAKSQCLANDGRLESEM